MPDDAGWYPSGAAPVAVSAQDIENRISGQYPYLGRLPYCAGSLSAGPIPHNGEVLSVGHIMDTVWFRYWW